MPSLSNVHLVYFFIALSKFITMTTMSDLNESSQGNSKAAVIPTRTTNWNLCCLCQLNNKDTTSPATNGYPDSYQKLANIVMTLDRMGHLSFPLDIRRLNCGSGIASTLLENKATVHNGCRKKIDDEKVQRAQKRAQVLDDGSNDLLPISQKRHLAL